MDCLSADWDHESKLSFCSLGLDDRHNDDGSQHKATTSRMMHILLREGSVT